MLPYANFELSETAKKMILDPAADTNGAIVREGRKSHVRYDAITVTQEGDNATVTMLYRGDAMCIMKLRCNLARREILNMEHLDGRMELSGV